MHVSAGAVLKGAPAGRRTKGALLAATQGPQAAPDQHRSSTHHAPAGGLAPRVCITCCTLCTRPCLRQVGRADWHRVHAER